MDLGFLSYPEARRGMKIVKWRNEQMTVALYPGHPFASRRKVLPADLEGQSFVAFDSDVPIRRELDRFLKKPMSAWPSPVTSTIFNPSRKRWPWVPASAFYRPEPWKQRSGRDAWSHSPWMLRVSPAPAP